LKSVNDSKSIPAATAIKNQFIRNSHHFGKPMGNIITNPQTTIEMAKVNQSLHIGSKGTGNLTYMMGSPKDKDINS